MQLGLTLSHDVWFHKLHIVVDSAIFGHFTSEFCDTHTTHIQREKGLWKRSAYLYGLQVHGANVSIHGQFHS